MTSGNEKVLVDKEIPPVSVVKEENIITLENGGIERNDKPNDAPILSSASEERTFSLRSMWSKFSTSMTNLLKDIESHY